MKFRITYLCNDGKKRTRTIKALDCNLAEIAAMSKIRNSAKTYAQRPHSLYRCEKIES